MSKELNYSFFTTYGTYLSPIYANSTTNPPFEGHPQFPTIVDILARKYHHHLILCTHFPSLFKRFYLETLLTYLSTDQVPTLLRTNEMVFIDTEHLLENKKTQKLLEKEVENLHASLNGAEYYQLVAMTTADLLTRENELTNQLQALINHPKCRIIIFADAEKALHDHYPDFTFLAVDDLKQVDTIRLLKHQAAELAQFHQVTIPDELINQTYALAKRYFNHKEVLSNALLLLDSSAARAGAAQPKNILTANDITQVLSQWTSIPASHLQWDHFDLKVFRENMQLRLFGQEAAIAILGQEIRKTQTVLRPRPGPLFHFLFAGPHHTGKKTAAIALVQQLFQQLNVLYFANLDADMTTSFAEMKLQRAQDKQYVPLKEVIHQIPYAVIMFEAIEQASPLILDGLHELLMTGMIRDNEDHTYSFQQAIIILSTKLGAEHLSKIAKTFTTPAGPYQADLMHLIMNEQRIDNTTVAQYYTPQELVAEIFPDITGQLPSMFWQTACIVPFLPLNKPAVEKIIHLTLRDLSRQLNDRYAIDLEYAPEVIHYLSKQVLGSEKERRIIDINEAIEQLYACVEQGLINCFNKSNSFKHLFLQLNETGQLLRCDWLADPTIRQHAL